jgi:hypothetical protein
MDENRPDLPLSSGDEHPLPGSLDAALEQALAAYTAAEPSPDLAVRILAAAPLAAGSSPVAPLPAVAAGSIPVPHRPLGWILAASGWLAAAATCLLWFHGHPFQIVIQAPVVQQQMVSAAPAPAPVLAQAPVAPPVRPAAARSHAGRSAAPLDPITIEPIQFAPIHLGVNPQERP